MLEISWMEFVFRTIPEVILMVFAIHAFAKVRVDKSKYLISILVLAVAVFIIRMLPIDYGVHTILNIIVLIVITCAISKIEVIKAIKSAIILTIALFVCEGINVFFLQSILGLDLLAEFSNIKAKIIYSSPSLMLFFVIIMGYYRFLKNRNELKDV